MDRTENIRQSRAADKNAVYLGLDPLVLMENAGRDLAGYAERFESIAVFCGRGNNGGDGLVAARHLACQGKKVTAYILKGACSKECQTQIDIIEKLRSVELRILGDSTDCKTLRLEPYDCVIDALLGVGACGKTREPIKSLVQTINRSNAFCISADCPTPGLQADLIVSFYLPKSENARVSHIGIPPDIERLCGPGDVYLAFPKRQSISHKGDFGRLGIIGGSKDFSMTPALVAKAALRTGVDLAVIQTPEYAAKMLTGAADIIVKPLSSKDIFSEKDAVSVLNENYDAIVLGNGMGLNKETTPAVKKIARETKVPLILDADALKHICRSDIKPNFILTPHAAEFETLFGKDAQHDPDIVKRYAKETKATIILKGETDIISDGSRIKLNTTGNPAMTVGGTGDVLAGIVGCLACKNELFTAACAGAFLSGLAGDLAFKEKNYGLTATDCIERIPCALDICMRFKKNG